MEEVRDENLAEKSGQNFIARKDNPLRRSYLSPTIRILANNSSTANVRDDSGQEDVARSDEFLLRADFSAAKQLWLSCVERRDAPQFEHLVGSVSRIDGLHTFLHEPPN